MKFCSLHLCSLLGIVVSTLILPRVQADGSLQQVIVIMNHGERAPRDSASLNSGIPQGGDHLTERGIRQSFELGQRFRQVYANDQFMKSKYDRSEVYFRSTDTEATLESAQSFALGFYPLGSGPKVGADFILPQGYQPVPVHTVSLREDWLLLADHNCPALKQIWDDLVDTQEWKDKILSDGDVIEQMSNVLKRPLSLRTWKEEVYDYLFFDSDDDNLNQVTGVSQEIAQRALDLTSWVISQQYGSVEIGRLAGGELVAHIFEALQQKIEAPKSSPKMIVYSAHDRSLLGLLGALKLSYSNVPSPASYVVFELHKHTVAGKLISTIKILYNDQVITNHVGKCGGEYCLMEALARHVRTSIPLNWEDDCQIEIHVDSSNHLWSYITKISGLLLVLYITRSFWSTFQKCCKRRPKLKGKV